MRWLAAVIALSWLCLARPAAADDADPADPDVDVDANLWVATASSEKSGDEITKSVAAAPAGTIYRFDIKCVSDAGTAVCNNPITCNTPPGSVRYDVFISTDSGATFVKDSETCMTNPPDSAPPEITPALVATEFQAIAWPQSPLQIQPPGGRTLVNLETNFFTTNTQPILQPITLLEQQVEIEATPTTWTWHHGDGSSQSTQKPGAAYPALDITHTYLAVSTVAPSVDTTYTGRYRVNGGPWIAIPATATVAGTPAQLEIVPAKPQLVAAE